MTKLTKKNMIFRNITLGLHIIAIMAYFLPTLFFGGRMGTGWLIGGVLLTALFCVMFFRDARRRTVLSIIIMILLIAWSAGLFLVLASSMAGSFGYSPVPVTIYSFATLLAAIFALANPRRYSDNVEISP